jgi:hypothetical protein
MCEDFVKAWEGKGKNSLVDSLVQSKYEHSGVLGHVEANNVKNYSQKDASDFLRPELHKY